MSVLIVHTTDQDPDKCIAFQIETKKTPFIIVVERPSQPNQGNHDEHHNHAPTPFQLPPRPISDSPQAAPQINQLLALCYFMMSAQPTGQLLLEMERGFQATYPVHGLVEPHAYAGIAAYIVLHRNQDVPRALGAIVRCLLHHSCGKVASRDLSVFERMLGMGLVCAAVPDYTPPREIIMQYVWQTVRAVQTPNLLRAHAPPGRIGVDVPCWTGALQRAAALHTYMFGHDPVLIGLAVAEKTRGHVVLLAN